MKKSVIVLIVLVLIVILLGGMYAGRRNEMVRKTETIHSAWAQVDNVLQRRADLIPNLVATVKGIAAQEQTVFHDVDRRPRRLTRRQKPRRKNRRQRPTRRRPRPPASQS